MHMHTFNIHVINFEPTSVNFNSTITTISISFTTIISLGFVQIYIMSSFIYVVVSMRVKHTYITDSRITKDFN